MSADERTTCESYELRLSAWLDENIDRIEQHELVDHLVRCSECREFYAQSRALAGLVTMADGGAELEAPPAELWERIQERVAQPPASSSAWVWRAAAALLLGAALAFLPWPATQPDDRSGRMDIVLEADRGDMTESRFLQLAAEVLRADRRYHFAMQQVMDRVIDEEWGPEGVSSEGISEDRANDPDDDDGSPFRV